MRDFVYRHSPYAIQNLLISAYGLYLRRVRYGRAYQSTLDYLRSAAKWSSQRLESEQRLRLNTIVASALRDVPHYRERYSSSNFAAKDFGVEDLSHAFAVLEKAEVKKDSKQFVSEAVDPKQTMTVFTSGSTGAPLEVVATNRSVADNFAHFSYFLEQCGLDPFETSATFAGRLIVPKEQGRPPFWRYNSATRTWLLSSYHISPTNVASYVEQLRRIKPRFIDSYPSSIYAIAQYVVSRGVDIGFKLKGVVTSSETLMGHQRAAIEQAFGCKVYDQYGSAEMVAFLAQCSAGKYHSHPLYGVVEVLKENGEAAGPGESGELVVTGLLNIAMPLIRYRIGDRAVVGQGPCPCGSEHPVFEQILGREDDFIVTLDGALVGRLDPLFKGLRGIDEAQIIQHTRSRVEVLIVPRLDFDTESKEGLMRGLRARIGEGIAIEVNTVAKIPRGPGGKFRSVVSKVRAEMR